MTLLTRREIRELVVRAASFLQVSLSLSLQRAQQRVPCKAREGVRNSVRTVTRRIDKTSPFVQNNILYLTPKFSIPARTVRESEHAPQPPLSRFEANQIKKKNGAKRVRHDCSRRSEHLLATREISSSLRTGPKESVAAKKCVLVSVLSYFLSYMSST